MKTAVSLPDALFKRADQLARRLGVTRSELYQRALSEYVRRHDPAEITRALDDLADELDTTLDAPQAGVVRRSLERVEW